MTLIDLLLSDLERYYRVYEIPNFSVKPRHVWKCFVNPRLLPVALYRVSHQCDRKGWSALAKSIAWLNFYLHGAEIYSKAEIGPGLFFPHANGIVIGARRIGSNATIYHQVTLGGKRIEIGEQGRPSVGDNVVIGSGAKVLGDICVGDDVVIGANTLVIESIPSNHSALGVPAVLKARTVIRQIN